MTQTPVKKCSACKAVLALTSDNFHKDATNKDGWRRCCRVCGAKSSKKNREKNALKNAAHAVTAPKNIVVQRLPGDVSPVTNVSVERWRNLAAFEQAHLDIADEAIAESQPGYWDDPRHDEPAPAAQPVIEVVTVEETVTRVEEHRLKRRIKDLEGELRELTEQLDEGGKYGEVIQEVLARQGEAREPRIQPRERKSGLREGMPLVLASDWHIEEEVRPEQVQGRNRYNLEIATRRMERFFEATRWGINQQRDTFKIRDLMMWLGGDLITNFLHEDNVESNLLHPTEAILFAQTEITKGIEFLLQDSEIEQFVFPCNDGNHGRTTKKMRSATRTQNSLEVFLYAQLAMHFRNEPRVKFILPTSSFNYVHDVYGRTIRFLHGDVFKYGGGIGGIFVPMFRALGRWEKLMHADLTCLGHWHQRICLPDVMVNGSLIGFNSYATDIGASFEPPVQSMRMLEPLRWCSTDIPLWVSDREDDEMNGAYDKAA